MTRNGHKNIDYGFLPTMHHTYIPYNTFIVVYGRVVITWNRSFVSLLGVAILSTRLQNIYLKIGH